MNEYLVVKLLHLIGFAYWLGGDLGVFISSFFVVNERLSRDARVTAAKILFSVDQGPRVSMTMMLPLGVHLAWKLGLLPISAAALTGIWAGCLVWLAMVITLHVATNSKHRSLLMGIDFYFRLLLSLSLIAYGLYSLLGPGQLPYWLAAKFAIFGALVGCGLLIRIQLKPFASAFANLVQDQATAADQAIIRRKLSATRPLVVTIWIGLLLSAALGIHLL